MVRLVPGVVRGRPARKGRRARRALSVRPAHGELRARRVLLVQSVRQELQALLVRPEPLARQGLLVRRAHKAALVTLLISMP